MSEEQTVEERLAAALADKEELTRETAKMNQSLAESRRRIRELETQNQNGNVDSDFAQKYQDSQSKLEAAESRANEYLAVIEASNAESLNRVPEEMRSVYADLNPMQLQKHMPAILAAHAPPAAPETGAGRSGGGGEEIASLTPAQKEFAAQAGISEEKYLARAQQLGVVKTA